MLNKPHAHLKMQTRKDILMSESLERMCDRNSYMLVYLCVCLWLCVVSAYTCSGKYWPKCSPAALVYMYIYSVCYSLWIWNIGHTRLSSHSDTPLDPRPLRPQSVAQICVCTCIWKDRWACPHVRLISIIIFLCLRLTYYIYIYICGWLLVKGTLMAHDNTISSSGIDVRFLIYRETFLGKQAINICVFQRECIARLFRMWVKCDDVTSTSNTWKW